MQFGYFDEEKRECVITRPDTPTPWVNYLGSPEYGVVISSNAGGYSFVKSGANGRILRYIFNNFGQPGRYIYIRDNADGNYWSASQQPIRKGLESCHSRYCHGTGYTRMLVNYKGIRSEARYFAPLNRSYKVWNLSVISTSNEKRELAITGYAEFASSSSYEQGQVNLQYSQFITRTCFREGRIRQMIRGSLDGLGEDEDIDDKVIIERFFGFAGASVTSYCESKEKFIGRYHGYGSSVGVESGKLSGEMSYNGDSCDVLAAVIRPAPGEERQVTFLLRMKYEEEVPAAVVVYEGTKAVYDAQTEELITYWHEKLSHSQVKTPNKEFDIMINTWSACSCFMTFIWSRAAPFIYCGLENGYGCRDTVQDIQGVIHLTPEMTVEKLRFMLSTQVDNGGGLSLVKYTHNPGHEDAPDDASCVQETGHPAYRADDALWLFPAVYKYTSESGSLDFIDGVIPFANKDEGTVCEHLRRAINFSISHLGIHEMPAGLYAGWNDCLRLGKDRGPSFVAMQFYYAMTILRGSAEYERGEEYTVYLEKGQNELAEKTEEFCWNEDHFIRGFIKTGEIIGNRNDPEANIQLNPQSQSVVSGCTSEERVDVALDNVFEILNTAYGAILMNPPYHEHAFNKALAVIYSVGTKENSGIFSQSQGQIILAEALRGHGERTFTYFIENAPSAQNDHAEVQELEPCCCGQFTEGKTSPGFGRSHVHWLTGTASTVMVSCVEGILNMRPDFYGLRTAPTVPKEWDTFEIEKDFGGEHLHIVVENPEHAGSGCEEMYINSERIEGNYIPEGKLTAQTKIKYVMQGIKKEEKAEAVVPLYCLLRLFRSRFGIRSPLRPEILRLIFVWGKPRSFLGHMYRMALRRKGQVNGDINDSISGIPRQIFRFFYS